MKSHNCQLYSRCGRLFLLLVAMIVLMAGGASAVYGEDEDASSSESKDEYTESDYYWDYEEVNEWEDRVLIAATGLMEYEGRIYYAYGDYVDELLSYFTQDGLELSEGEAKDAIAQISDSQNIRAGAQSGYLYQVGGKPADSDSLVENAAYDGKLYPEFDEEIRYQDESEYRQSDLYQNNKAYIEERSGSVYESQSAMREEMRKIAEADREYKEILSTRGEDAGTEEILAPKNAGLVFLIAEGLILAAVVTVIVINWKNGTISLLLGLDDEDWNRGNSKRDRHRMRKRSAILLTVITGINLAVLYAGLTYHSTIGSDHYIEDAIDRGGICQHSYMEFRDNVHGYLGANALPQNALDLALTYRDFRFDYIKGTRSAMKRGDGEVRYRGVQEVVETQIDLLAYVTKKDSGKVTAGVNDLYEASLSTDIGVFLYQLRESAKGPYRYGFILAVIGLVLSALMMILERHNIYQGVKDLAGGVLVGTGLWACMTGALALALGGQSFGLASDDVYVMFTEAAGGLTGKMIPLLIASAVVAVLMFGAAVIMRKKESY